jgi:hypothetical protein
MPNSVDADKFKIQYFVKLLLYIYFLIFKNFILIYFLLSNEYTVFFNVSYIYFLRFIVI